MYFIGSQALPGNRMSCRLCLPDVLFICCLFGRVGGGASKTVRYQAEPGSALLSDRKQFVLRANKNRLVRSHRRAVDTAAHVDFVDRFFVVGSEFKNGNVTVFITNVNMTIGNQRATPTLSQHVIGKVNNRLVVLWTLLHRGNAAVPRSRRRKARHP